MSNLQKWLLVLAALIASLGILLCGLDRYVWVPGQNDVYGKAFMPRIFDSWTGENKSVS